MKFHLGEIGYSPSVSTLVMRLFFIIRHRLSDVVYATLVIDRYLYNVVCAMPFVHAFYHFWNGIIAISLLRFLLCDFIQVILFERFNLSGITFQRRYDGRHWIRRRLLLCHLSVGEV